MEVPPSVARIAPLTARLGCCPYCLNPPVDDSGCCPPDGACPCAGLHVSSPEAQETAARWAAGYRPWRP